MIKFSKPMKEMTLNRRVLKNQQLGSYLSKNSKKSQKKNSLTYKSII